RKMIKKKLFEMNTSKGKTGQLLPGNKETVEQIKKRLRPYFMEDVKELDALIGTRFSEKWFNAINN
ncbi:MAG TPA: hypothetical protein VN958_14645, partial [Chitinophagaceae bacterium]|nr:hypothetical protein [Chitinophagaceae bacterium]